MSDTPKTDAFEALVNRPMDWWDWARQLERENAALKAELEAAKAFYHVAITERDAARKEMACTNR